MAAAVRGVAFSKSKFPGEELAVTKVGGSMGVLFTCRFWPPPQLEARTVQASPLGDIIKFIGMERIGEGVVMTPPRWRWR